MHRQLAVVTLAVLSAGLLAGSGCQDPVELTWTACPFATGTGECAEVDVPANWNDGDGDHLTVSVQRLGDPAADGQQIWLLAGGPGSSGEAYQTMAQLLVDRDPSVVVYLLDHRGTGGSSRLGCPTQEAEDSDEGFDISVDEYPACIASLQAEWGTSLDYFSTTMAAHDLGWLIDKTRRPNQQVHVYGASYGTFWLQRYLQLYPTQATAASMLGVVAPEFSFAGYHQQYETVGGEVLAACGQDAFCASKLGPDPQATFRDVMDDLGGYCPAAGLDRETLRDYFGGQLLRGWEERLLPLAIIYRIQRCAPGDVDALRRLADVIASTVQTSDVYDPEYSDVLHHHIALSEQWEAPTPSLAQAQDLLDDGLWAFGTTKKFELAASWPTYAEDQYADQFAEVSIPLLMLNGEFDPATPLAQALTVGEHFSGADQHFVTIPDGTHSLKSPLPDGSWCAREMLFAFMQDPTAPLLDCMDDVVPLDFQGTVSFVLGTPDLWEN